MRRTPEEFQALILEYLRANPGSEAVDIRLGTGLNMSGVRKHLLELVSDGRARREVPPRLGPHCYWATTREDMEIVA